MRLAAASAALLLAACSQAPEEPPVDEENLVDCALAGAMDFARDCAVERTLEGEALVLVVRHPDGSFRRFEVLADGRGLAAADGADRAQITLEGEGIAVTVGQDRYRFPATVAGDGA
jgi:hypothetical protein